MTRAELPDRIDVLISGRSVEDIVFGHVATGAQNNSRRATDITRHVLTQVGMNETPRRRSS
jgi:cell division protease FtsH